MEPCPSRARRKCRVPTGPSGTPCRSGTPEWQTWIPQPATGPARSATLTTGGRRQRLPIGPRETISISASGCTQCSEVRLPPLSITLSGTGASLRGSSSSRSRESADCSKGARRFTRARRGGSSRRSLLQAPTRNSFNRPGTGWRHREARSSATTSAAACWTRWRCPFGQRCTSSITGRPTRPAPSPVRAASSSSSGRTSLNRIGTSPRVKEVSADKAAPRKSSGRVSMSPDRTAV